MIIYLFFFTGFCHQDAVHITAILGESVVFNCHVEFPDQHPVPYVLQWEKKVGDTVRYKKNQVQLLSNDRDFIERASPFVKGMLLLPSNNALSDKIIEIKTQPNDSENEFGFLVR